MVEKDWRNELNEETQSFQQKKIILFWSAAALMALYFLLMGAEFSGVIAEDKTGVHTVLVRIYEVVLVSYAAYNQMAIVAGERKKIAVKRMPGEFFPVAWIVYYIVLIGMFRFGFGNPTVIIGNLETVLIVFAIFFGTAGFQKLRELRAVL